MGRGGGGAASSISAVWDGLRIGCGDVVVRTCRKREISEIYETNTNKQHECFLIYRFVRPAHLILARYLPRCGRDVITDEGCCINEASACAGGVYAAAPKAGNTFGRKNAFWSLFPVIPCAARLRVAARLKGGGKKGTGALLAGTGEGMLVILLLARFPLFFKSSFETFGKHQL